MEFRKRSLNVVINILAVIATMVLAVVETILLIIPAVITALCIDRWPGWMWGGTKKLFRLIPEDIKDPLEFKRSH